MTRASRSVERVRDALERHGLDARVERFPSSTRTAADAARAVGCDVAQIAKSLVFRGKTSGDAVLLVVSGANRVDLAKASHEVGEELEMADADFVRASTGFAVGGVAPVGLEHPLPIYVDRDLLELEPIWAAAGTPDSVFPLTPRQLLELTAATPIDVK